jgi:hypothetical protein
MAVLTYVLHRHIEFTKDTFNKILDVLLAANIKKPKEE